MSQWSGFYGFSRIDENTVYFNNNNAEETLNGLAPFGGILCLRGSTIQAFQITVVFNRLFLKDFVYQYGLPNAVTWMYRDPKDRIVFWFEHGMALEVYADRTKKDFGLVSSIIFFPFQSANNYQQRWPFLRTAPSEYPESLKTQYPDLELTGQQNPFDFRSMIATLTIQPPPTATPTFTPRPMTPTITPTSSTPTKDPVGQNKVAFVSDRDGFPTLYVMNSDGTDQLSFPVKESRSYASSPSWSVDGNYLAFSSSYDDGRDTEVFVTNSTFSFGSSHQSVQTRGFIAFCREVCTHSRYEPNMESTVLVGYMATGLCRG